MKVQHIILLSLLTVSNFLYGQHQSDNWYFGNKAGVNFSTGSPVALTNGQMNQDEGVSSISDANGNLLFYTDGITVWNRLHVQMDNGNGLAGGFSSTQVMITAKPGTDSIYYIFTVDMEGLEKGLCYSTVNINSAGGLGKVIQKNVLLLERVCEKIAVSIHHNQRDKWIVTHGFAYPNNKFYSWLLSDSGVSMNPVISVSSNYIGLNSLLQTETIGYMKISPDGSKIASAYYFPGSIEIDSFNNSTGQISNALKINPFPPLAEALPNGDYVYGIEFSPNSKLLYTTTHRYVNYTTNNILMCINQYNISSHNSAAIEQSHYYIDTFRTINVLVRTALQIAPNNKIYISTLNSNYLSAINNPNNTGSGAGFTNLAVNLNGRTAKWGLPGFINNVNSVLPLKLLSFRVFLNNELPKIIWSTSDEHNSKIFEIQQKTIHDSSFKILGHVDARNRNGINNYIFISSSPIYSGMNLYRLKILDIDERFTYSNIISLNSFEINTLELSFNPSRNDLIVYYPSYNTDSELQIINLSGQIIYYDKIRSGTINKTIKINFLKPGIYFALIKNSKNRLSKKFIKN